MPSLGMGLKLTSNLGSASGSAPYFLQSNPGANFAWSLSRKLSSTYNGACIRVRRTTPDTSEQDIPFSGRFIDTNSLMTFVGSGDGHVVTVYGQVGGYNLVQPTFINQPKIVNAGVLNTIGGRPAALFSSSTNTFLQLFNHPISTSTNITVLTAFKAPSPSKGIFFKVGGANNGISIGIGSTTQHQAGAYLIALLEQVSYFPDDFITNPNDFLAYNTSSNISSFNVNSAGNSVKISLNGIERTFTTTAPFAPSSSSSEPMRVGGFQKGPENRFLDGSISELIIYPAMSDLSRRVAESNMKTYYGSL